MQSSWRTMKGSISRAAFERRGISISLNRCEVELGAGQVTSGF
jgi:hypothetical protein